MPSWVPFEEDLRNPVSDVALTPPQAVFYLDHNYLENMLGMFRKVNARERKELGTIQSSNLCTEILQYTPTGGRRGAAQEGKSK